MIEERLQLTGCKAAINLSLQSSGSQTFNQHRAHTDHTDGHPVNTSPEAAVDYEQESKQLNSVCEQSLTRV